MKKASKVGLILVAAAVTCFVVVTTSVILYMYAKRSQSVFYRIDSMDCCPTVFIQNPFRDKTRELVSEKLMSGMQGKTVTEAVTENPNIGFNNPKGILEPGKLTKWELMNRADSASETDFYYAIYRDDNLRNPDSLRLSFAVVKVTKIDSGWRVTSYIWHGTSNNS
ncbi:MAG: hypothetical protein WBD27_04905 [Pyrinomonadaceae bacterium]